MFTLPQEIEVWYIIPALRREISKCLVKNKYSYEKVGVVLGISKAAVSQYINGKRADKIKLHDRVAKELNKSCNLIISGKSDSVKEITKILKFVRDKKLHCEKCGKKVEGKYHNCKEIKILGL